jgi:DNA-binding CsgD family transcriptional regulator
MTQKELEKPTAYQITRNQEIREMDRARIEYYMTVHPKLSETEAHIFMHVMDRKQNKEIAKIYGCSVRNIEAHRYRIGKKLGRVLTPDESGGERVAPHYDTPTVGVGAAKGAIKARTKPKKTPGRSAISPNLRRTAPQVEHAGTTGRHRHVSGRWLLPGVLFHLETREAWV